MTPNFLHIESRYEDAESMLASWVGRSLKVADLCLHTEKNGWVTLSIDLDYVKTEEWLALGQSLNFFYQSYSTSLCMGEIVFCRDQRLVRHLLIDDENPDECVDLGTLPSEALKPLKTWDDVWGFVDDWTWMENV
jgi:hypothetical protein